MMPLLFALHLVAQAEIPSFDPRLDWRTIESEHFKFHYPKNIEDVAFKIIEFAEPVYDTLTKKFQWEPREKTRVVVVDNTDDPNGLSSPWPYNAIYLYPTPPSDQSFLDHYDDWLRMLFIHEFTHIIHMDMSYGWAKIPRALFGSIVSYNSAQQQWVLEGLAIYEETEQTSAGRGRSPFVQMHLRTASLEDALIPIDRAIYFNNEYPYGNSAYWFGIGFYQFLKKRYGEQKILEWTRETASWIVPWFYNFKSAPIFGKSLTRLWDEWQQEEKAKWRELNQKYESRFQSKTITTDQLRLMGQPAFSDDGKFIYAVVRDEENSQLIEVDAETQKIRTLRKDNSAERIFFNDGKLYYSKLTNNLPYQVFYDVFEFNLKTNKERRLTWGQRIRDPIVADGKIIGVQTDKLRSRILRFPIPAEGSGTRLETPEFEVLFEANDYDALSKPSLSPDKDLLVFSMRVTNQARGLYLLDLRAKNLRSLVTDEHAANHPVFVDKGRAILFSSDYKLPGTDISVPNLFQINLATGKISRVTDVWTGISMPAVWNDKLAVGRYRPWGFELHQATLNQLSDDIAYSRTSKSAMNTSTLKQGPSKQSKEYSDPSTLLLRFWSPIVLYSESDTLFGAQTFANDPLGIHSWSALVYYLTEAKRPGGAFIYSYKGFSQATITTGFSASISNYGRILATQTGTSLSLLPDRYYELGLRGFVGIGTSLRNEHGPTGMNVSGYLFFEKTQNLLDWPAGTIFGRQNTVTNNLTGKTYKNVAMSPETGLVWGGGLRLRWSKSYRLSNQISNPRSGFIAQLNNEFTPHGAGSDFLQWTTILKLTNYFSLFRDFTLGTRFTAGAQWFPPLYQRTFRLGGAFGSGPFSSISPNAIPLRGMLAGDQRGDAVFAISEEFRFPLFERIPGFGTAPLWFKNIHGAIFGDAGQTFQLSENATLYEVISGRQVDGFGWNRFSLSVGGELRSDISVSYAPPLTFRLGYGYLLFRKGENVIDDQIAETYFLLGTSF